MKSHLLLAIAASALTAGALAQTAPAPKPVAPGAAKPAVAAPAKPAAPAISGTIDKAALAYALGYDFGRNMAEQAPGLDVLAINRAIQDGYAKKQPAIAGEKLQATVTAYQKQREAQAKAEFDRISRENKVKSDAALAANKVKPGVITLPNGIQYNVIEAGAGIKPSANSEVEFNFSGALATNGQVFASTFANIKPVSGKLSEVSQLPGMIEIMQQMPVGARWQILLPAEKAWGNGVESARGGPGPNQAVFLDIKLISVK